MIILVIGSEGFIGSHLVEYFLSKKYNVYGIDLVEPKPRHGYNYYKISRLKPEFVYFLSQIEFNVCINAAGSGSVPASLANPLNDFEANVSDTFHILEAIRLKNQGIKYVNISSAAVYGNPAKLPVLESDPVKPLSPYGFHKYYSELLCKEYYELYNIPTCSLRPFSVYGPGLKKQLFWDLYEKLSLNPNELILYGTGSESRDFIFIDDLVAAFDVILEKAEMKGEVYNVASGTEVTVKEAVELFVHLSHLKPLISFIGKGRDGDPLNWRADISMLRRHGFLPYTGLFEGLNKYIAWLRENE